MGTPLRRTTDVYEKLFPDFLSNNHAIFVLCGKREPKLGVPG